MSNPHLSIKVVAQRTGLTSHVIRIWEKRYGAVQPSRTDTNRRLYSEAEIERLNLLGLATRSGHSIGNVARLPTETLRLMVAEPSPSTNGELSLRAAGTQPDQHVEDCIAHICLLDAPALEECLRRATLALGNQGVLRLVVGPLAQQIGDQWREGRLTSAQEHFASACIGRFLAESARPFAWTAAAPRLVVATPSGQLHELGAAIVAAAATDLGWRVTYLGASLPASEIAAAAVQSSARAVALSIVYPEDDPNLPKELESLRRCLLPGTPILAGGRAAAAYADTLAHIHALRASDITELYHHLDSLRASSKQAA
jgi:methylmalonyl-CoA mutase cobalamin-binding domain/chain